MDFVGNIFKFTALPGTTRDKYAVRITSVIREEDEGEDAVSEYDEE